MNNHESLRDHNFCQHCPVAAPIANHPPVQTTPPHPTPKSASGILVPTPPPVICQPSVWKYHNLHDFQASLHGRSHWIFLTSSAGKFILNSRQPDPWRVWKGGPGGGWKTRSAGSSGSGESGDKCPTKTMLAGIMLEHHGPPPEGNPWTSWEGNPWKRKQKTMKIGDELFNKYDDNALRPVPQ